METINYLHNAHGTLFWQLLSNASKVGHSKWVTISRVPALTSAHPTSQHIVFEILLSAICAAICCRTKRRFSCDLKWIACKRGEIRLLCMCECILAHSFYRQRSSASFHFFYDFSFRLFFLSFFLASRAFIWIVRQRNYIENVCCNEVLTKKKKRIRVWEESFSAPDTDPHLMPPFNINLVRLPKFKIKSRDEVSDHKFRWCWQLFLFSPLWHGNEARREKKWNIFFIVAKIVINRTFFLFAHRLSLWYGVELDFLVFFPPLGSIARPHFRSEFFTLHSPLHWRPAEAAPAASSLPQRFLFFSILFYTLGQSTE